MIKKNIAIVTAVVTMASTGAAFAVGKGFSDTGGHWAKNAIEWASSQGLVTGDSGKSTFRPNDSVSRAELVTVLQRYHEKMDAMMNDQMGAKMEMPYQLLLENLSDDQPLAPGVAVIHTANSSLNFEGEVAPESLEQLAEIGNPAEFKAFVEDLEGVVSVYETGLILPGENTMIELNEMNHSLRVSVLTMAVASNDGYALIDSMELFAGNSQEAVNHDAGFEDNTELGSGFEGGQPDPSQGELNVENGTATVPQGVVEVHPQLGSDLLRASIK